MNRAARRRQQKLVKQSKGGTVAATAELAIPLGQKHHGEGNFEEAERYYLQALTLNPQNPDALHLLGVVALQTGRNERAIELISKAIALKPGTANFHSNLGNAYRNLGQLDKALENYRRAIDLNPNFADAFNNIGVALQNSGELEGAIEHYKKATELQPDHRNARYNLGSILHQIGQYEASIDIFYTALELDPKDARSHDGVGILLTKQGQHLDAFNSHHRAVILEPKNETYWSNLALSLEPLRFADADENLLLIMSLILMQRFIQPAGIVSPIISALVHHPLFQPIYVELTQTELSEPQRPYAEISADLSGILLWLQTISLTSIANLEIELMLTRLRRALIEAALAGKCDAAGLPFSSALALHCFTNEFVFSETNSETQLVTQLEQKIADLMEADQDVPHEFIAALGTFRPLYTYPWAEKLGALGWGGEIGGVVKRQILNPLYERSLRDKIPTLTPIDGKVSREVRAQYEENPYPRWVKAKIRSEGVPIDQFMRKAHNFDLGDYVAPNSPEILIAGCGTGQHVFVSTSNFSDARVLAIDLSLSSLSYAARRAHEIGTTNIDFAQADIMELHRLDRQFDLIESCGVLHHLGDPLAGWKVLVDMLRPDGLMKIALYSETARQAVVAGRKLIAEGDYTSSAQDIRRFRRDIIAKAQAGDTEMATLFSARDFYSLSECRDLLFHVQEHRFTLPQIQQDLDHLGLEFLGMDVARKNIKGAFNEKFSTGKTPGTLAQWNEFEQENPQTFISMYQFWCRKKTPGKPQVFPASVSHQGIPEY